MPLTWELPAAAGLAWAAVAAVLLLVSAECWMMCSIGHSCGQMTTQPPVPVPSIGDLFAGL
jgi:hypothetical protein